MAYPNLYSAQLGSKYDTIENQLASSRENLAEIKRRKLAQREEEKRQKLSLKTQDPYLQEITGVNNRSTAMTGAEGGHGRQGMIHDYQDQGEKLGELWNEARVETRPDGTKYYTKYDWAGIEHDEPGMQTDNPETTWQEIDLEKNPFDESYDTRNAYLKTKDDLAKFGLARSDLTQEAIDRGITPEKARYMNQEGLDFKLYSGNYSPYQGTPGVEGQGFETQFDTEFLKDPITKFEYDRYRDVGTINARAAGTGTISDDEREAFGSGVSEYTLQSKDPLFGGDVSRDRFEYDTPLPVVPYGFNADGTKRDGIADDIYLKDRSFLESAGNTMRGLGATFYKELVYDTADLVGDATGLYQLGDEAEKTKDINEWFGFDTRYQEKANNRVSLIADAIFDDYKENGTINIDAIADGAFIAFTTSENLSTSLGVIAAWMMPGAILTKGDRAAKAYKAIDKAVDAGRKSKTAGLLKKAEIAFGSKAGLKHALKSQSGMISAAMGNVNDQYEEFVKNNNGVELEGVEKVVWMAKAMVVQMFNQNLDKITAVSIIKSPALLKAAKDSIESIGEKALGSFALNVGKTILAAGANAPKEALQEYTQEMMEMYNTGYGSEKFKDLDTFTKFVTDEDNVKQSISASLQGIGGSGQFSLMGASKKAVGSAANLMLDSMSEAGENVNPRSEENINLANYMAITDPDKDVGGGAVSDFHKKWKSDTSKEAISITRNQIAPQGKDKGKGVGLHLAELMVDDSLTDAHGDTITPSEAIANVRKSAKTIQKEGQDDSSSMMVDFAANLLYGIRNTSNKNASDEVIEQKSKEAINALVQNMSPQEIEAMTEQMIARTLTNSLSGSDGATTNADNVTSYNLDSIKRSKKAILDLVPMMQGSDFGTPGTTDGGGDSDVMNKLLDMVTSISKRIEAIESKIMSGDTEVKGQVSSEEVQESFGDVVDQISYKGFSPFGTHLRGIDEYKKDIESGAVEIKPENIDQKTGNLSIVKDLFKWSNARVNKPSYYKRETDVDNKLFANIVNENVNMIGIAQDMIKNIESQDTADTDAKNRNLVALDSTIKNLTISTDGLLKKNDSLSSRGINSTADILAVADKMKIVEEETKMANQPKTETIKTDEGIKDGETSETTEEIIDDTQVGTSEEYATIGVEEEPVKIERTSESARQIVNNTEIDTENQFSIGKDAREELSSWSDDELKAALGDKEFVNRIIDLDKALAEGNDNLESTAEDDFSEDKDIEERLNELKYLLTGEDIAEEISEETISIETLIGDKPTPVVPEEESTVDKEPATEEGTTEGDSPTNEQVETKEEVEEQVETEVDTETEEDVIKIVEKELSRAEKDRESLSDKDKKIYDDLIADIDALKEEIKKERQEIANLAVKVDMKSKTAEVVDKSKEDSDEIDGTPKQIRSRIKMLKEAKDKFSKKAKKKKYSQNKEYMESVEGKLDQIETEKTLKEYDKAIDTLNQVLVEKDFKKVNLTRSKEESKILKEEAKGMLMSNAQEAIYQDIYVLQESLAKQKGIAKKAEESEKEIQDRMVSKIEKDLKRKKNLLANQKIIDGYIVDKAKEAGINISIKDVDSIKSINKIPAGEIRNKVIDFVNLYRNMDESIKENISLAVPKDVVAGTIGISNIINRAMSLKFGKGSSRNILGMPVRDKVREDTEEQQDVFELLQDILEENSLPIIGTINQKTNTKNTDLYKEELPHHKATSVRIDENGGLVGDIKRINKLSRDVSENLEINPLTMIFGVNEYIAEGALKGTRLDNFQATSNIIKNAINIGIVKLMSDIVKSAAESDPVKVDKIWGVSASSLFRDVSESDNSIHNLSTMQAKGVVPRHAVLDSVGKEIMSNIPIKLGDDIDMHLKAQIETALALYAVDVAIRSNIIKTDVKDIGLEAVDGVVNVGEKNVVPLRVNLREANMEGVENYDAFGGKDYTSMLSVLDSLKVTESNTPANDAPVEEVNTKDKNSNNESSMFANEYKKEQQSIPYKFNRTARRLYEIFKDLKSKNGQNTAFEMLHDMLDIKDAKDGHVGENQKKKAQNSNEQLILFDTMLYMEKMENEHGTTDQDVYFNWESTVSNRYMIDNTINPQNIPLIRFLMNAEDMRDSIDISDEQKLNELKLALAQAFDLGNDKNLDTEVIKKLDEIVTIDEKGVSFVEGHSESKNLKSVFDSMSGSSNLDTKAYRAVMREFEGSHALSAIRTLSELDKHIKENDSGSKKEFEHEMTVESDAISSGMILLLMQIASSGALQMMEKGGIYSEESIKFWTGIAEKIGYKFSKIRKDGTPEINHGELLAIAKTIKEDKNIAEKLKKDLNSDDFARAQFSDFYLSVTKLVQEDINNKKESLEEAFIEKDLELEELRSEYDKLKKNSDKKEMAKEILALTRDRENIIKAKLVLELVGEIGRNDAKESVLVYVYGASANSIQRKLAYGLIRNKMYENISKLPDHESNPEYLYEDQSVLDKNMDTASEIYRENGNIKEAIEYLEDTYPDIKNLKDENDHGKAISLILLNMSIPSKSRTNYATTAIHLNKELKSDLYVPPHNVKGVRELEFLIELEEGPKLTDVNHDEYNTPELISASKDIRNLHIDDEIVSEIFPAVKMSLGSMFKNAFKKLFKDIDEARDMQKSMEVVRTMIFKYQYNKELTKFLKNKYGSKKKKDFVLTRDEFNQILETLKEGGWIHGYDNIDGAIQTLSNSELDQTGKRVFVNTHASGGESSNMSANSPERVEAINTGASSVINIHSIDGHVEAMATKGFKVLNIFDASLTSPSKEVEVAEGYNDQLGNVMESWSIFESQAELLINQINNMSDTEKTNMLSEMSENKQTMEMLENTVVSLMDVDIDHMKIEETAGFDTISYHTDKLAETMIGLMDNRANLNGQTFEFRHTHNSDAASNQIRKLKTSRSGLGYNSNTKANNAVKKIFKLYGEILNELKVYTEREYAEFKRPGIAKSKELIRKLSIGLNAEQKKQIEEIFEEYINCKL